MSSIDNRIVNMEFNNGQFEAGVNQSIGTLDKLKNSLKLEDAAVGMNKLTQAANGFDLSRIEQGVSALQNRFNTLGVAGMAAIQNLTNRALNAGIELVKGFTVDPILDGFNELETKNKAITTIMANVGEKNTVDDVTRALDELNTYADKTIYNFAQMTDNIGRFTAAGVDLDTSVRGIKGMSNLAAFFGASNSQAQRAMYQMSQALATGTIRLMDWNSMVQAGMGGTAMSDLLVDVARKQGKGVDEALEKYGSFRESLRTGWLDNDVFMETLGYFAEEIDDTNAAMKKQEYIARGWSEEMADHLVYLGKTATDSATRVRSYQQLMDTMSEEVGSSWTSTFDLLLGGYNGTTRFWDDIYQAVSPALSLMNNIRNAGLLSWVNMGGQKSLMETLRLWLGSDENSTRGIKNEMLAIGNAFTDVFGLTDAVDAWASGDPTRKAEVGSTHLGQILMRFTSGLHDFIANTQLTETGISNLGDTWEGLVSVFDIGAQAFGTVVNIGGQLISTFSPLKEIFLALTAPVGRVARSFRDWVLSFDPFMKLSQGFHAITQPIHDGLQWIADGLTHGFDMAKLEDIFRGTLDFFTNLGAGIVGFFTGGAAIPLGDAIGGWFAAAGQQIATIAQNPIFTNLGQGLVDGYNKALDFAKPYFENASSLGDYFTGFSQMSSDAFQVVADTAEQYLPVAGKMFGNFVRGFKENTKVDALTLGTFIEGHKQLMDMGYTGPMDMTGSMLMDSMISLSDFMYKFGKTTGFQMPDIFTPMVEGAQNAVSAIKGYFSDAHDFSGYFDGAKNMASDMVTYIQERFQDVAQNLPGIWANFQEQFGKAKDYVKDHAKDIPEATKTMAERVRDTMGNLVERFQSSAVGTSLAGAFEGIQQKVLDVVQFFKDHKTDIWEALQDFGHNISEGIKNFIPEVIDWVDDFFGRIVEKFTNASDNGIFDRIGDAFGKAGEAIGKGFQDFGKSIGEGFQSMGDFFQYNSGGQLMLDIPWNDIAMIGQMIAMIAVLNQTKNLISTLNTTATSISDMVKGWKNEKRGPFGWAKQISDSISGFFKEWGKVGTSLSTAITKTSKWLGISMFLKALVPVLAAVAGLAGIAIVDPQAVITASVCVGALGALFAAVGSWGSNVDGGNFDPTRLMNMGQLAIGLAALAGSIWIISSAVKKLGKLNGDEIVQGMVNVGIIATGMTTAMGFLTSNKWGAAGKPGIGNEIFLEMAGMAVAVWAMSNAVKKLGTMDAGSVVGGLVALGAILTELDAALIVASKVSKNGQFISNFGTLAGFGIAALALATSLKMVAGIEWEGIAKGLVGLGGAMTEMGVAIGLMSRISGSGDLKIKGMVGMGAAILAIAGSFKMLEGVSWDTIGQGLVGLGGVLAELTAVSAVIGHFQGVSNGFTLLTTALLKLGAAAALFGIGFGGIAAFVGVLNDLKTAVSGEGIGESFARLVDGIIEGFAMVKGKVMAFLMGVITSFIEAIGQYAGRIAQAIGKALSEIFRGLAQVTPEVVSAFKAFTDSLFGEIQKQFGDIDWEQFGEIFENLVVTPMLTALVGKLANVKMGDIAKVAAAVLLTVGPLVAAVALLSQVGNQTGIDALAGIENVIESVTGITVIMGLLSRFTGLGLGDMAGGAAALGVAIDVLLGIVGGLATLIGAVPGWASSISTGVGAMQEIIDVIKQFDATFVLLCAAIGSFGGAGVGAMAAGAAGIGVAIDVVTGIVGGLSTVFGLIDSWSGGGFIDVLDRGAEAFTKIGEAVGGLFGGITSGYLAGAADKMPEVTKQLQTAFSGMKPMMDDLEEMGDPGVNRIQKFVDTIKTMSELNTINLGSKTDAFNAFAEQLPDVGGYLKDFTDKLEGVNTTNLDTGIDAMSKMVNFAKDLPDSPDWNLGQWFAGRKQTLSEFAQGLKDFYPAMQEAIGVFGSGEDLDTSGLTEAIEAAQKISDLQNSLQGFQGASVVSFFAGRQQNLTEFAQGIGAWKEQLKAATDAFGAADTFDTTGFEKAVDVTNKLNDLALKLPPVESLGSALVGGIPKSLGSFATDISEMASVISGIDWTFGNFDPEASGYDEGRVSKVFDVLTRLTNMAKELPTSTEFDAVWGLIHWESGSMTSLGQFCSDISAHATEIGSCMSALGSIRLTATGRTNIPVIGSALSDLASAQNSLAGLDVNTNGGVSVSKKVTSLGEFVSSLNESDFISQMQTFMGAVGSFQPPGGDFNNLTQISDAIGKLAETYNGLPPDMPETGDDKSGRLTNLAEQSKTMVEALQELSGIAFNDEGGFSQDKLNSLDGAVSAVQKLADAYNTVSPTIEAMSRADGQNMYQATDVSKNWTTFTDGLKALATGMREFWSIMDDMDTPEGEVSTPWDTDRISAIVDDVGKLAGLVGDNGVLKDIQETDFMQFHDALANQLGPGLRGFYEAIEDFDQDPGNGMQGIETARISDVISSIEQLSGLVGEEGPLKDFKADGFDELSKALNADLGSSLRSFYDSLFGEGTFNYNNTQLTNAMAGIPLIADAFNNLPNITGDTTAKVSILADCISSFMGSFFGGEKDGPSALFQNRFFKGGESTNVDQLMVIIGQLSTLADGIRAISDAFSSMTDIDIPTVQGVTDQLSQLMDIFGGGGQGSLQSKLGLFGSGTTGAYGEAAGGMMSVVSNVQQFASAMQSLSTALSSMGGVGDMSGGGVLQQLSALLDKMSSFDFAGLASNIQLISSALSSLGGGGPMGPTLSGAPMGGGTSGISMLLQLLQQLQSIDLASIAANITTMANALNSLNGGVGGVTGGGAIQQLVQLIQMLSTIDLSAATAQITQFTTSLQQIAIGIQSATSQVTAALQQMIQACVNILNQARAQFQQAGMMAAQGYANGITSGTGAVTGAVGSMVSQAVNQAQLGYSGFYDAGVMAANGMAAGIRSAAAQVAAEAAAMVNDAIAAAKAAQASASPSKKYMELGRYAGQGYAIGMQQEGSSVMKAVNDMIVPAIQKARELANRDLTMKPVIQPVVDMSNIDSSIGQINGTFNSMHTQALARGVSMASSVARRMRENSEGTSEEENQTNSVTYNFTQNNTSPKALSRSEIYRDTKNLFALVKERTSK